MPALRTFGWLCLGWVVAFPGFFVPGVSVPPLLAASGSSAFVITSDSLEMDDNAQVAVFTGDVRAEERQMQLTSDRMTVNYHRDTTGLSAGKPGGRGGIDFIRAEGHVILLQGDTRGTAERMVYRVEDQTLEMLGIRRDASIRRGKDRLKGKKILLTLDSDRSISKVSVQGGDRRRVSARITPSGKTDVGATAGSEGVSLPPPRPVSRP